VIDDPPGLPYRLSPCSAHSGSNGRSPHPGLAKARRTKGVCEMTLRRNCCAERSVIFLAVFLVGLAAVAGDAGGGQALPEAGDLIERSRAAYAALRSYADTGVVTAEDRLPGSPAVVEHHTFATYYRAPRQFLFDFTEDEKAGGERFVIWCDGGDFNTWWSTTGVHEKYERGRGGVAFAVGSLPTKGSALLIPPLLFSQAGLQGPLVSLQEPRLAGTEEVGGRRSYKITADMRLAYGTGNVGEERAVTIWIDAETLLVRKVFQDTPRGGMAGAVSRLTTTFAGRPRPRRRPLSLCGAVRETVVDPREDPLKSRLSPERKEELPCRG
jgi:hypothetical protein